MKSTFFVALSILAIIAFLYLNFSKRKSVFEHQIVLTHKAPKPIGPYSQAVITGNTLFVSGQIAINPLTGDLDTVSIIAETERVMSNIAAVLDTAQMTFANVVKSTIYLTDMKNFKNVNEVYGKHFSSSTPARETVEVKGLPKGAHVEISVIAIK